MAAQVGLARRESPTRARRYLGWAQVLAAELPQTLAALRRGDTTEWRAMLVARETGWLSAEHRCLVDAALARRLDPHGYLARIRAAETDRRVTLRPAPDTMARLSGLLPVAQGVAAYASLTRHADTLVERVTGQATAAAVPIEINQVMTDQTLFNRRPAPADPAEPGGDDRPEQHHRPEQHGGADEPAYLHGVGPIPADLARRLVAEADPTTRMWLRRLYTHPHTGALAATDSRARVFDHGIRRLLVIRDQTCRTPWCGAPIRHGDHVIAHHHGGPTSADNGQGLCQACNHAKQAPGCQTTPSLNGAGDPVVTTTPTGHHYTSRPPPPPGGTTPHPHRGRRPGGTPDRVPRASPAGDAA